MTSSSPSLSLPLSPFAFPSCHTCCFLLQLWCSEGARELLASKTESWAEVLTGSLEGLSFAYCSLPPVLRYFSYISSVPLDVSALSVHLHHPLPSLPLQCSYPKLNPFLCHLDDSLTGVVLLLMRIFTTTSPLRVSTWFNCNEAGVLCLPSSS